MSNEAYRKVQETFLKSKRLPRAKMLLRLQELVGGAIGDYWNDRAPDRADRLIPALQEAFEIVVVLRSKYAA